MANNVRTAIDLERKYNFAEIMGMTKNVKMNTKSITKVENELINMLNTLIINLKDVLDSQSDISLWFYSGQPTLSNEPYISWITPSDHYGDIYYDQATGYVYQFSNDGWTRNEDTNLIQSMALTNIELDVSDHERKVFFAQPTIPYSSGDWWILEDGTLKICQLGKTTGQYDVQDFIVANRYTPTIADQDGDIITIKRGQVIKMSDTFASFEDLATGGKTIINGANITTGTIDTDHVTIGNGNVTMDEDGIKLNNGAKIINSDGLLANLEYQGLGYQGGVASKVGFQFIGFSEDLQDSINIKDYIEILADIPSNFVIKEAKITLIHQPVFWSNIPYYGYSRNIGLYKAGIDSYVQAEMSSEYREIPSTLTEIQNAFATGGWTPSVPSSGHCIVESKQSIDIKSQLTSGTLNRLIIQTRDSIPSL